MRFSKLFGKTTKTEFANATLVSHQLLLRGGFIRESVAGRYYFLPLGWRVHQKIQAIIKSEMDACGAQEMLAPTLHPLELWEETNRTTAASFELMRVSDRRDGKFALGGTAEEMFVDLVRKTKPFSHRDLPFNIYQFSTKFRDEMRARGGLLRLREFIMKDAYSFHADAVDFRLEYEKMWQAYLRIFEKMGLSAHAVEADNGYIGGEYCHEFQVESSVGEGRFFVAPSGYAAHEDCAQFLRDEKNLVDPIEPMREIDAVRGNSMEEGVKFHHLPLWQQMKDVAFIDDRGRFVLAVLRGDLDVCEPKLQKLIGALTLRMATDDEIRAIGSEPGFLCPVGLDPQRVLIVADSSLRTAKNLYGGANAKHRDRLGINFDRDFSAAIEGDIAMAFDGASAVDGSGALVEKRGIEVGNIFQLGTHYTNLMRGAVFADTDGAEKPFYMGCYGIGLARTLATIVEISHDDRGIIWPASVAPFAVALVAIGADDSIKIAAESLYSDLVNAGVEVLFDDRDASAGAKLADADLLGIPLRVVISPKTLAQNAVEIKKRTESEAHLVPLSKVISMLSD